MLFLHYLVFLITVLFTIVIVEALPRQTNNNLFNLTDLENYIQEKKQFVNPRFRQKYHISAPVGWINDPNGFSIFKNEYHMFYQFHPYSSKWGPMHWGHVKSKNLVDWEYLPTALIPGDEYDKNGCFSGSAIEYDEKLVLLYTGNIDSSENGNSQNQNLAISLDGVTFQKYKGNPVISNVPEGGLPDFRDPKIWKHGDFFYMVLGNASPSGNGRVLLYKSIDLVDWLYLGVLAESDSTIGYMWECPDFFELNGKYVLMMSPQGIMQSGERYKNLHQTGYLIGSFDYETNIFTIENEVFQELDYGHDFYAAQTIQTPDGRRIAVGWLDMWESNFEEQEDNWAGTLSLPRELTLNDDGKILMNPIRELQNLRDQLLFSGVLKSENNIGFGLNNIQISATVIFSEDETVGIDFWISESKVIKLYYTSSEQFMVLDRGGGEDGIRRVSWKSTGMINWNIYLDSSSIEVFCENGEIVFSTRMYPSQPVQIETVGKLMFVNVYSLRRSVEN